MGHSNDEKIESLEDTIIFQVEEDSSTKEQNVIREKNEVVDFTHPVEVLSDVEKDSSKKEKKSAKIKKDKKKKGFHPFSKIKSWWTNLSKQKKLIIILLFVLVILLAVVGIIFFNKKDNKKPAKKAPDVIVENDFYRYENGTLVFMDSDNNEIGKYKCKNQDQKKCYVAFQSNEDDFTGDIYLNESGNKLDRRAKIVNNNYVFIVDNKKGLDDDMVLYSIKNKTNHDEYKLVKESSINKNFVVLKDLDNKYGVIDLSGDEPKVLINFVYDYVGMINSDMANKYVVLLKNGKYYISDFTEKLLSGGLNQKIVEYNDQYIVTKDGENKYKIYDYDDNELQSQSYLFIKLNNEYYAAVLDNGVYVYDKVGTKYNEVPIALTSNTFNRTYTFDANNQLISNDIAFEISTNDDYITITRGKAIDSLSIKEANANKDHAYLNYYNGILYFYSNPEKTALIGKYTCKNRNNPGSFDLCDIATSVSMSNNDMTSGVASGKIAILNNRYVFIKDSLSTGNIYLYDLVANKKLGPYNDVEAYDLTSDKESVKSINGAYVIAKNKNNQYGLLRINNQSVDVVLSFEYASIEKEGEYFLVKKENGSYSLYNQSGNALTKDFGIKIVSYNENYCLGKSVSGYSLFNYNGEKVDTNMYAYIYLASNYYVGIIDNNLGIYKYNNPSVNVLQSPVKIKNADSWKDANYFKVSASQLGYIINITDGENNKEYTFDENGLLKE
ncbi:MAG: hypothetical protein IKX00_02955 [Bacilli bacterium]|nr:hypothetical protein [Bacilli bacterium]